MRICLVWNVVFFCVCVYVCVIACFLLLMLFCVFFSIIFISSFAEADQGLEYPSQTLMTMFILLDYAQGACISHAMKCRLCYYQGNIFRFCVPKTS